MYFHIQREFFRKKQELESLIRVYPIEVIFWRFNGTKK